MVVHAMPSISRSTAAPLVAACLLNPSGRAEIAWNSPRIAHCSPIWRSFRSPMACSSARAHAAAIEKIGRPISPKEGVPFKLALNSNARGRMTKTYAGDAGDILKLTTASDSCADHRRHAAATAIQRAVDFISLRPAKAARRRGRSGVLPLQSIARAGLAASLASTLRKRLAVIFFDTAQRAIPGRRLSLNEFRFPRMTKDNPSVRAEAAVIHAGAQVAIGRRFEDRAASFHAHALARLHLIVFFQ